MVAGSRLSIISASKAPLDPMRCPAEAMNQLVEYNLSPPCGPDCWISERKPSPMNMVFQFPKWVMIMGMGHASGFCEVPDERFMRYIPAGFMSPMLIPGVPCAAAL